MQRLLLLLPAAIILCAATPARDFRSIMNEAPSAYLPVPVAGVRVSQLRDSWGDARSEGRTHEGIDIMAARGTAVLSTTHGIVRAVEWRDLGGNTVSILGPGGYSHYYAHLDSYGRFTPGDYVEVGDTLGFVGNTGNASGTAPHLHYGIYTADGAINPYPLLTATPVVAVSSSTATTPEAAAGQAAASEIRRRPVTSTNTPAGSQVRRTPGAQQSAQKKSTGGAKANTAASSQRRR